MRRILLSLLAVTTIARAQDGIPFGHEDSFLRGSLSPSVELSYWAASGRNSGTLFLPDDAFFAPRLSLALDAAAGDHFFFSALARLDRGFDGGDVEDGDLRLDEIFLRWRPMGDERINFQAGRFPTVFGSWVAQHDFYDDPFLLPPLPYSQIIGIQERNPGALSPAAINARATGAAASIGRLDKRNWASPLWGPVYATGASVFGSAEHLDYALELKSSGLSSHPDQWDEDAGEFSAPTLAGRLGWRPDAAWAFGLSAARGSYLAESAEPLLPAGRNRDDFNQTTLGADLRWAHRDWIITAEIIASEYETLAAGDLRSVAWYLGARWKVAPGFWLAARAGHLSGDDVRAPSGAMVPWTPEVWRGELAAGWRLNERALLKAQYSYTDSDDSAAGDHLFGMALGVKW